MIIILVILVICLAGYIIYEKITIAEEKTKTKEEIIKQNFLDDIELVKQGKGTANQKYLLCDDNYDCQKIDKFSINSVEFYKNDEDNQSIYKFELSWSCKGNSKCFYSDDTKTDEVQAFYKVDETNRIITKLDNNEDDNNSDNFTIETDKNGIIKFPNNDSSVKTYVKINYADNNCNIENCYIVDNSKINKNLKIKNENINIIYNCDDYEQDEATGIKYCQENSLTIDNKITFKITVNFELGEKATYIIKTNKYYFIQQAGLEYGNGRIAIYDINGNLVKEINKTVTDFSLYFANERNYENYDMKLYNSKLYFVTSDDNNNEGDYIESDNNNYIHFNYIDLKNNFNIVELKKTKALTRQVY